MNDENADTRAEYIDAVNAAVEQAGLGSPDSELAALQLAVAIGTEMLIALGAVKSEDFNDYVNADVALCKWCRKPVKATDDKTTTYGVIGVDGTLCCDDGIDGCAACDDGEAHPHEITDVAMRRLVGPGRGHMKAIPDSATTKRLDTPLSDADSELHDLLVSLAELHIDNPARPCCDADTTLRDWIDSGLYTETEGRST